MRTQWMLICLLMLVAPRVMRAQAGPPALPAADSIVSDWGVRFPDATSQRDFRRLREYRVQKQSALEDEEAKLATLRDIRQYEENEGQIRAQWEDHVAGLLDDAPSETGAIFIDRSFPLEIDNLLGATTPGNVPVAQLRELEHRMAHLDSASHTKLAEVDSVARRVRTSINTLREDLRHVEAAIDNALAPEYQSQKFRTWVSAFFAGLIAVMIIAFFATIYMRAGNSVGSLLLSDSGLQFVTIFVLIIAIILFGILNVLEGRELAAILSGIAGYILGRGSQARVRASGEESEQPAGPAPAAGAAAIGTPPSSIRVPGLFLPPAPPERAPAAQTPQAEPPAAPPAEKPAPAAAG